MVTLAMRYDRPTELADHLVFLSTIEDPNYTDEFGTTSASVYVEAWAAIEHFIEHTPAEEGKEKLRQCVRNLHVAFEYLENGDGVSASDLVMETEDMFKRARKYIAISDE
jgi:hypothetical protein